MGRIYTAVFDDVTITVVQDLFQMLMASNVNAKLHSIYLVQTNLIAQEILKIKVHRGSTNGSGGGTPPTPRATVPGPHEGNSDCTVEINNTTQSTEGDIVLIRGWNLLVPFEYLPIPEKRIVVPGGDILAIELDDAPSSSMMTSGEIGWEEEG